MCGSSYVTREAALFAPCEVLPRCHCHRCPAGTCSQYFPRWTVAQCGETGEIFFIDGDSARPYPAEAYAAHGSPEVDYVEPAPCSRILRGCTKGPAMTEDPVTTGVELDGELRAALLLGGRRWAAIEC